MTYESEAKRLGAPTISTGAICKDRLAVAAYPQRPAHLAGSNVEGWVWLGYDIAKEGTAENISVVGSKPEGVFDAVAIAALSKNRFHGGSTRTGCQSVYTFGVHER